MKSNILSRIRFGSELLKEKSRSSDGKESFQVRTTNVFDYTKKTRTLSLVAEFPEIGFWGLELTNKSVRDKSFGSATQIQMGLLEFFSDFFRYFWI